MERPKSQDRSSQGRQRLRMNGQNLATPCSNGKQSPGGSVCNGDYSMRSEVRSPCSKARSEPGSRTARGEGTRRKLVCSNLGATPGQLGLISVSSGLDPLRPPYCVTVRYDLRLLAGSLSRDTMVFLAALDTEKLRRKGSGMGLDVLRASESWIARDCMCTKSGKLKPLPARDCPGEVHLELAPSFTGDRDEDCVLLRVVALRQPLVDPHEWHVLGAAVLLRVDTQRPKADQPPEPHWRRMKTPRALNKASPPLDSGGGRSPEHMGVRVKQLLDFRDDICHDLANYCGAHQICIAPGWHENQHVCIHEPCPFRPINLPKYDEHKEVPVVKYANLNTNETSGLMKMNPDMNTVVTRYIKPMTSGTGKSLASMMNPERPLKVSAFVTHLWSEDFNDFVDTLQIALDREEVVYVSSFSLDQNADRQSIVSTERCAFAAAIRAAEKFIIIADKSLDILSRLWCIFEMDTAREARKPTFVWPHEHADLEVLQRSAEDLDVASAVASDVRDQHEILEVVKQDFHNLETFNQQLRPWLQSRIECFASSLDLATEGQGFSTEKLRRVTAELERVVYTSEHEWQRRRLERDRDEEAERHRCATRELEAAHAGKISALQQRFVEAELEHTQDLARQESDARAYVEDQRQDVARLEGLLQEARAKTAHLEQQLSSEQRRCEEWRVLAEQQGMRNEEVLHVMNDEVARQSQFASEERDRRRNWEKRASQLDSTVKSLNDEVRKKDQEMAELSRKAREQAEGTERQIKELTDENTRHRENSKQGVMINVQEADTNGETSREDPRKPSAMSAGSSGLSVPPPEPSVSPSPSSSSNVTSDTKQGALSGAAANASKAVLGAATSWAGRFKLSRKKGGGEDGA